MGRAKKEVHPSDLSDGQWTLVAPVLHQAVGRGGRVSCREILQRDLLCSSHGLPVAFFAQELPAPEDGLLVLLALAKKWSLGAGAGVIEVRYAQGRNAPWAQAHDAV